MTKTTPRKAGASKSPTPNKASSVAETLTKPDLHQDWIVNYRNAAVNRFTAMALDAVIRRIDLKPGAKVLDAGCGSGTNSIWLTQRGFGVTGIDFSDFALGKAEERARGEGLEGRIGFSRADLTNLAMTDASFDAVFCIGVLMHIPEVEAALDQLVRVLKPGGVLIIQEANANAPETYAFRLYWKLRRRGIRVERKPCGVEVWSETSAGPLLSRKMSIPWLTRFLGGRGLKRLVRMPSELTEAYVYFGNPMLRKVFHGVNALWFKARGPAAASLGNLMAFRKHGRP